MIQSDTDSILKIKAEARVKLAVSKATFASSDIQITSNIRIHDAFRVYWALRRCKGLLEAVIEVCYHDVLHANRGTAAVCCIFMYNRWPLFSGMKKKIEITFIVYLEHEKPQYMCISVCVDMLMDILRTNNWHIEFSSSFVKIYTYPYTKRP